MDLIKTKVTEIDLAKLFGKDRAQEDINLQYYFVKTRQYSEIQNGAKELVLGRKGSGKSAFFSMLKNEAPSNGEIPIAIAFGGEDFVHIENALKANQVSFDVNDDFKFSLAWRDFIVSEIIYQSVAEQDKIDSQIKKILSDAGYIKPNKWKRFADSLLSVLKGARLKGEYGEIDFDLSSLRLEEGNKLTIKESFNAIVKNNKFIVLIDNLDEPWVNSNTMNSWLRGLIFAIRQIKRDYNNIKIVAFLRSDIYDVISRGSDLFDSKSEITTLTWDDNNFLNLRKLIAMRIAYYFGLPSPNTLPDISALWNNLFPQTIRYGGRSDVFWHYIIIRTFQRPRELLQFCRLLLEDSQKTYLPIEDSIVSPVELKYSNWKESDLIGEYSKTYRNLGECIDSFIGAKRTWDWTCPDLLKHLNGLKENETIFYLSTNTQATPKEAIIILYRIGFLRKVSASHFDRYKMYHQDTSINFVSSRFDIHPAFRKRFTNQ